MRAVVHPDSLRPAGWDLASAKVTVNGNGNSRISFTTREDTARFLVYVLTRLATSELSGKTIRIEGDNVVSGFLLRTRPLITRTFQTFNEAIAAYESQTGKKVEVTHVPREVLAEKAAAGDLLSTFYYDVDMNGGEVGKPLDNELFLDWNPKKVLEIIS